MYIHQKIGEYQGWNAARQGDMRLVALESV